MLLPPLHTSANRDCWATIFCISVYGIQTDLGCMTNEEAIPGFRV